MSYTGSVLMRWAMSTDADLAGYKVYQGASPGLYTRTQQLSLGGQGSTDAPAWTVTQIENNVPYYLALTAMDTSLNESLFSAEITVTKPVPLLSLVRQL